MTALSKQPTRNDCETVLHGTSICPGIAIGRIHMVDAEVSIPQTRIDSGQVASEQKRYTQAVEAAKQHLRKHVASMHSGSHLEAQAIFESHQAILADESFHDLVRSCIEQQGMCAEFCLNQNAQTLIAQFNNMRDPYLQSRREDIRDLALNLLAFLSGKPRGHHHPIQSSDILVSRHLHPSEVIRTHQANGLGFASESSALTSHAAILLKGFGIPAIGKIKALIENVDEGMPVILDGDRGVLIANPSAQTLKDYQAKVAATAQMNGSPTPQRCTTGSGEPITLRANIENPEQAQLMLAHGLEGIGLFRTEFLITPGKQVPSEEEQYRAYRSVVETAAGRRVNIRTFDIGGDKQMGLSCPCTGLNPSLGIRGIRRHLMVNPDELRIQLRAILRAAHRSDTALLIPMVTTPEEIEQTKQILTEVKQALRKEGAEFLDSIPLGVMIEIPAAAIATRDILSRVDFINLGTNDLLQYFMAADRDNEQVVDFNDPTNPAFLWLLEFILAEARKTGRENDVAICGEIASNVEMIPRLLKMGYRSFSIAPVIADSFRKLCAEEAIQ
ncbi:phosphoenolpyruvate--protein phosphotransferase [Pontiellaceae bacterium B1224]|nr:phosphoenolpyruvate--protein phosphotransferase [Pontiellaceae bacterium B1224]